MRKKKFKIISIEPNDHRLGLSLKETDPKDMQKAEKPTAKEEVTKEKEEKEKKLVKAEKPAQKEKKKTAKKK